MSYNSRLASALLRPSLSSTSHNTKKLLVKKNSVNYFIRYFNSKTPFEKNIENLNKNEIVNFKLQFPLKIQNVIERDKFKFTLERSDRPSSMATTTKTFIENGFTIKENLLHYVLNLNEFKRKIIKSDFVVKYYPNNLTNFSSLKKTYNPIEGLINSFWNFIKNTLNNWDFGKKIINFFSRVLDYIDYLLFTYFPADIWNWLFKDLEISKDLANLIFLSIALFMNYWFINNVIRYIIGYSNDLHKLLFHIASVLMWTIWFPDTRHLTEFSSVIILFDMLMIYILLHSFMVKKLFASMIFEDMIILIRGPSFYLHCYIFSCVMLYIILFASGVIDYNNLCPDNHHAKKLFFEISMTLPIVKFLSFSIKVWLKNMYWMRSFINLKLFGI